jgi:Protein of unknown function (DUF2795)
MREEEWARIRKRLGAVRFPADKRDLVAFAERAGDEQLLRAVRSLPLGEYQSVDEIRAAVLDPDSDQDRDADLAARQARSAHDHRIAEHLRDEPRRDEP